MSDIYRFIKNINYDKNNELAKEKHYQESKNQLINVVEKRIKTTMIGAIATIEESLSCFWKTEEGSMNEEQKQIYNIFQDMRSKILDNGNNQIRLLEKDVDNFNIEAKKYHISFQIKPRNTSGKE